MAAHNPLRCVIASALLLLGSSALAGDHRASNQRGGSPFLLDQADALQYDHQFDSALALIKRALHQGEQVQRARLMQARILLAQGRIADARNSCASLMGKASLTITGTCLLEVRGREVFAANNQEALAQTYRQLQQIAVPIETSPALANLSEIVIWQRQILAEQAFLLGRFSESITWLNYAPFDEHPTVNQLRILDNWLAMSQPEKAFEVRKGCPQVGKLPPDSIIVRLAAAERALETKECWQNLASERIAIRVARNDPLHTSDLAYYFVHVAPDATKAQRYAQQNFAIAQEPADQRLLLAAQALQPSYASQEARNEP